MELFRSGGGGVIPAATTVPVLPKRLAARAPAPSAESIISCQPVSIASISSDMNARPTMAIEATAQLVRTRCGTQPRRMTVRRALVHLAGSFRAA